MSRYVTTGIAGLDEVLNGGIPQSSVIIVEGTPGTGKTTLGLQYLYEGAVKEGEGGVYITFEQLPSQLYKDALSFQWDLRRLEKENKLRIVCISPELLMQEIVKPDGLFERIIAEVDCKRLVIDSISLLRYAAPSLGIARKNMYQLRVILRKWNITALLIREQLEDTGDVIPFENYVADGVIQLSLKPYMDKYRKRTLEVLKMRGTSIIEGEHIIKFMNDGLHLAPLFRMVQDKELLDNNRTNMLPTGLSELDSLLGGGLPQGTVFILDTNSQANYHYILNAVFFERLRRKDRVVSILSGMNHYDSLSRFARLFGVDLEREIREGRATFFDHYNRPVPPELKEGFIQAGEMDHTEFLTLIRQTLSDKLRDSSGYGRDQKVFLHMDLCTLFTFRGMDFMLKALSEEVANARQNGITVFALCNFAEIPDETSSFLERLGNGVIRTWVDGNYQFVQVTKSPTGNMTPPYLIESIHERPFIRLV